MVAFAIASASLIVFTAVTLRYIFGYSVSAFDEITRYLTVYITFIGASRLLHQDGHVTVEALLVAVPRRVRRWLEIIAALAGMLCCLGLTWLGISMLVQTVAIDLRSMSALRMPMWLPQAAVPLGAALMALRLLQRVVRLVRTGPTRPPD